MERENAEVAAKIATYKEWVRSVFSNLNLTLGAVDLASKREGFTESEFQAIELAAALEAIRCLASDEWSDVKTARLLDVLAFFQIPMKGLEKSTLDFFRFVCILTLLDLSKGIIPHRITDDGSFTMLIKAKDEHLIWGAPNGFYAEDKKVRNPGYGGMSVRVLPGVWARAGAHSSAFSEGLVVIDDGECVLTNKAFYFFGRHQSLEIVIQDILSVECVTDGVADGVIICKRNQSTRNQFFPTGGSGWFVSRAIKFLVSMSRN